MIVCVLPVVRSFWLSLKAEPMTLILYALSILVLILLSAFFSSSETALTKASRARLYQQKREGSRGAAKAEGLLEDQESMLATILLGNNLVNILATSLATSLFLSLLGEAGVAIATLIMTISVVIFAEIVPKTYAIRNADRYALLVSYPLGIMVTLLRPVLWFIRKSVSIALWLLGDRGKVSDEREASEEELRGAIELHADSEEQESIEARNMLRSILDLSDITVSEVFTHRKNVEMIDISKGIDKVLQQVLESPYTRFPLYDGNPEEIIGILHAKALLRAIRSESNANSIDIRAIAHEPWFILSSRGLDDQLRAFRQRSTHFALVVDEYGSFEGIITLEDILEEIVGDINDEHDEKVKGLVLHGDGSYVVEGKMTIRDLNRALEANLPDEDATTVAGLLLHEARRIPHVGDLFVFHGFRFKVLERKRLQITSIQIWPTG